MLETVSYVKSGKLRALGGHGLHTLANATRYAYVGRSRRRECTLRIVDATIVAPADTPQPVVDKLASLVADAANSPDIMKKLTVQGVIANHSTPAAP